MKFKEVLEHLIRFHRIDEEGLPTFKARIQILRNVGVPAVNKTGKGAWADFTPDHVAELHLALTMAEFGFTPARISQLIEHVRIIPFTRNANQWLVISLRASNAKLSELESKDVIQSIAVVHSAGLQKHLDELSMRDVPLWIATLNLNKIVENLNSIE